MSLLVETPESPVLAAPRRRRSLLPVLAAALAIGGIVVSVVTAAPRAVSFDPLRVTASGAPFVTLPEYGAHGSDILGYEHGATVRLTIPVHNGSWLPVTVTDVQLAGGPAPLLATRGVEGLPLTLRPGGDGSVTLVATLTNCKYFHERAIQTFDQATLTFRSLGQSGSRVVPFERQLLVRSPMIVGCPDRKIDRELNQRGDLL